MRMDTKKQRVLQHLSTVVDILENVFCPTGPGGGVDPTCKPGGGSGSKGVDLISLANKVIVVGARSPGYNLHALEKNEDDKGLAEIYKARGYNAKPKVVSSEEFDKIQQQSGQEVMYRGVTQKEFFEHFKNDEEHRAGVGVFGNGTYVTVKSKGLEDPVNEATGYATLHDRQGVVSRMMMRKDAKSIKSLDLVEEQNKDFVQRDRAITEYQKNAQREGMARAMEDLANAHEIMRQENEKTQAVAGKMKEENDAYQTAFSDIGRYGAAKGYDIITHANPNNGYSIILNRGAVIVDDSPVKIGTYRITGT